MKLNAEETTMEELIAVRMHASTRRKIRELAAAKDRSEGWIIREAIKKFCSRGIVKSSNVKL